MANPLTTILIVARPSRIRDGLRVLLKTLPQVKLIEQVDDTAAALKVLAGSHPPLVLLGADLSEIDIFIISEQAKTDRRRSYCVALVDTVERQILATASGADQVLLTGLPTIEFLAAVERLLTSPILSTGGSKFQILTQGVGPTTPEL